MSMAATAAAADSPYVAVTAAEKRETGMLASQVVTAYRTGRLSILCDLLSQVDVTRQYGSPARCRSAMSRAGNPCARRCSYRVAMVVGAYLTDRDRLLRRKTIAWLYVVRGHPGFTGPSELELRFRKRQGRWFLLADVIEAGPGR